QGRSARLNFFDLPYVAKMIAKRPYIGVPIPPPKGSSDAAMVRKNRLQVRNRKSFTKTTPIQTRRSGMPFQKRNAPRTHTSNTDAILCLGESAILKTVTCASRNATTDDTRFTSLV